MIKGRNKEQVVTPEDSVGIKLRVTPGKPVTMGVSLLLAREKDSAAFDAVGFGRAAHVNRTNVNVIHGILIDAVLVIRLLTVSIVVSSLTVLDPAAHCSTDLTVFKVDKLFGKLDTTRRCDSTLEPFDLPPGVYCKNVDPLSIVVCGLAGFVPVGTTCAVR
jgi:hypothetical protein